MAGWFLISLFAYSGIMLQAVSWESAKALKSSLLERAFQWIWMEGLSIGWGVRRCSLLTISSFVFGDGKVVIFFFGYKEGRSPRENQKENYTGTSLAVVLNLVLILLLNVCSSISVSFKGVKNCLNQNLYEAKIFVFRKWKLSFFLSLFFKIKGRYINLVST